MAKILQYKSSVAATSTTYTITSTATSTTSTTSTITSTATSTTSTVTSTATSTTSTATYRQQDITAEVARAREELLRCEHPQKLLLFCGDYNEETEGPMVTLDPRASDPRASDPRAIDPRASDPRASDPRASDSQEEAGEGLTSQSKHLHSSSISSSDHLEPRLQASHSSQSSSPFSGRSLSPPEQEMPARTPRRMTTDERRASEEGIDVFISVQEIIHSDIHKLKDRLKSLMTQGMTEHQFEMAMDIRKGGKNTIAAQNSKKKKQTKIENLNREVEELKIRKLKLQHESDQLITSRRESQRNIEELSNTVISQWGSLDNIHGWDGDPDNWMMEEDPQRGIVNFKKIQGLPQLRALCRPAASLHRVPAGHRPYPFPGTQHSASLYLVHPASLHPASLHAPMAPLEPKPDRATTTARALWSVPPRQMDMEVEVKEEPEDQPEDLTTVSKMEVHIIE